MGNFFKQDKTSPDLFVHRLSKLNQILLLLTFSLVILCTLTITGADQKVIGTFFPEYGWSLGDLPFFKFLYDFGPIPSLALGAISLVAFIYFLFLTKSFRKSLPYAFPFMTLLIGPGLIVNSIFKDHWGRVRPRQVDLYGGSHTYTNFWTPNFQSEGRSFPSGHASVGFHLCCLAFLRKNPYRGAFFSFGIFWGLLIGLARILQGGHFLTDVIASGFFVLLTCILFSSQTRTTEVKQ